MWPSVQRTRVAASPESRNATLSLAFLASAALVYLAALEIGSRTVYPSHSTLAARIRSDWCAARQLRAPAANEHRSFLLLGNSLLQAAIDREEVSRLQERNGLTIATLPIENTHFLDWYFGLVRLLGAGAKPQFVALSLTPMQLTSDATEGEFSAWRLMRAVDILQVRQAAHLDWTSTSTYLLARGSAWIGNSAGIRNWITSRTVPGIDELAPYLAAPPAKPPPAEVIEEVSERRLARFSALCAAQGCRALLLIPPLLRVRGAGSLAAVARAARAADVPLLMPLAPGELGPAFFADGFHLNPRGAAEFTPRLMNALTAIAPD